MSQPTLAVAISNDTASIKVSGRATFECTEDLKSFALKVFEKGINNLILDMADCVSMDSTFMGMAAKLVLESRKMQKRITINNVTPGNRKNLFSLGIGSMFDFSETKEKKLTDFSEIEKQDITQSEQRQNIIDAHETLINADEKNRSEFQDIVDFLKMEKDLEEGTEEKD